MTINTERLKTDAAYWDEVAGTATHYCPSNKQFYDFRLHPCCIPRPTKPAAPEWDGEGIPPVGCECEYTAIQYSSAHPSISPNHWYRCKIIAYHDGAVWTSDNGIRQLRNTRFRPLRTAEQRERDEFRRWFIENRWNDVDTAIDNLLSRYNLEPKP